MDIQAVISIFLSCLIPIWEGFFVESEVLKDWPVLICRLFTLP